MNTIDNLHSIDNSICATTAVLFLAVLYVGLALCLIFFLSKPVARLRYAQSLKEKLPHVFAIAAISLTIATIYIYIFSVFSATETTRCFRILQDNKSDVISILERGTNSEDEIASTEYYIQKVNSLCEQAKFGRRFLPAHIIDLTDFPTLQAVESLKIPYIIKISS